MNSEVVGGVFYSRILLRSSGLQTFHPFRVKQHTSAIQPLTIQPFNHFSILRFLIFGSVFHIDFILISNTQYPISKIASCGVTPPSSWKGAGGEGFNRQPLAKSELTIQHPAV